jgi:hypothetical protein
MNKIDALWRPTKRGASAPKKSPGNSSFHGFLLVLAVTTGFGVSLWQNTRHVVNDFLSREFTDFKFDVFLMERADRSFLEERFLSSPGVRSVRFVTREEALGRAHEDPALAASVKLTVRNPLPESFEVSWDPAFLTPALLVPVAEKWEVLDGVARVGYDRSRLERVALLARMRDESGVVASAFLWGTLVSVVWGVGILLFSRTVSWTAGVPVGGLLTGALGGGGGALIVWAWVGAWEPAGLLAGALVGVLGAITRAGVSKG